MFKVLTAKPTKNGVYQMQGIEVATGEVITRGKTIARRKAIKRSNYIVGRVYIDVWVRKDGFIYKNEKCNRRDFLGTLADYVGYVGTWKELPPKP